MAIGTTSTFTVTRDQIINAALRGLHVYGPTDTTPAADITYCAEALNIMIKAWAARGLFVWCYGDVAFNATAMQSLYPIGETASTIIGALTSLNPSTIGTTQNGPQGIAIPTDGLSVYVANYNSNTVSMYSRNASTGALTPLGTPTIATGANPFGIVISTDGLSVYVANYTSNTVSMYSRNASTGVLTPLGTPTIATGANPFGIVISTDGSSVYVINVTSNTVSMYSRNTGTGALTPLGTPTIATGTNPQGIAISTDGLSVYVANYNSNTVSMYSRNTGTGALTPLGTPTIATGTNPQGIAISTDGLSVYVINVTSNTVSMYSRNTGTGALTLLGTLNIATGTNSSVIAISTDGLSVYVANYNSNTVSMYSRNTITGALTPLDTPTIATGTGPFGIVISTDGLSVYVANPISNTISMYSRIKNVVTTLRPIKIVSAYVRVNNVDTGIEIDSRFDYNSIDNKTTTGIPTKLFYDPQLVNGQLYLYPTPDAAYSIHLVVQRQIKDLNLSTDNPDFPQEFYQALKWGLMDEVALEYEAAPLTMKMSAEKSLAYFESAMKTQELDAESGRTTLSTTSAFGVNRDSIIQDALIEIGKYGPSDRIPATDITHCARALNTMVKAWAARGLFVWCYGDVVLTAVINQSSYQIGDTATGTGSLVTPRPINIVSAFVRVNNVDTGIEIDSRFDYNSIDNKTTTGTPTKLFYDPQPKNGQLYLYPTPDAAYSIHLTVRRQFNDITSSLVTNNLDFPQEFYQALKWGLMDEIVLGYKAPQEIIKVSSEKAVAYLASALKTQEIDAESGRTTLSTTSAFGVNRDSIIQDALIEIGKYGPSDRIPATDITHCARALNTMVKAWASKGALIWTIKEISVPTVSGVANYPIGTTAAYLYSATITNGGTSGTTGTYALGITGGGGTGATGTYTIANGAVTSITITAGGNSFTSAPALSFPSGGVSGATATATIVGLTTDRPMRVMQAYMHSAAGNDQEIQIVSRFDYNQLGQKTSSGTPNQMFYDPQSPNGIVTLYNVPADNLSTLHLVIQRQLNDITSSLVTNNLDFPQEFYQALKWGLMDEIALGYKAPQEIITMAAAKADKYINDLVSYEQEEASVQFAPSYRGR